MWTTELGSFDMISTSDKHRIQWENSKNIFVDNFINHNVPGYI